MFKVKGSFRLGKNLWMQRLDSDLEGPGYASVLIGGKGGAFALHGPHGVDIKLGQAGARADFSLESFADKDSENALLADGCRHFQAGNVSHSHVGLDAFQFKDDRLFCCDRLMQGDVQPLFLTLFRHAPFPDIRVEHIGDAVLAGKENGEGGDWGAADREGDMRLGSDYTFL